MSEKRGSKRARAAAAALIASAGIMVNAAVPNDDMNAAPTDDAPIVLTIAAGDDDGDDLDEDEAVTDDEEKRRGVYVRARAWMLRLPVWKRLLFLLPLWLLGWVLIALIGSPVLSWIVTAALLVLTVLAALKLAAPDQPIGEILNSRSWMTLLCGLLGTRAVCAIVDAVRDGPLPGLLARFVCGCVVAALTVAPILFPELEELLSPEVVEEETDAEILSLEDELFEKEE